MKQEACKMDVPCDQAVKNCSKCGHNPKEEARRKKMIRDGCMINEGGLWKLVLNRRPE